MGVRIPCCVLLWQAVCGNRRKSGRRARTDLHSHVPRLLRYYIKLDYTLRLLVCQMQCQRPSKAPGRKRHKTHTGQAALRQGEDFVFWCWPAFIWETPGKPMPGQGFYPTHFLHGVRRSFMALSNDDSIYVPPLQLSS